MIRKTLLIALSVAILGDMLLRGSEGLGLNGALWVACLGLAWLDLVRLREEDVSREAGVLVALAVVFAGAWVWRDAPMLKLANALVVVSALALPTLRSGSGWIAEAGPSLYARAMLRAGYGAVTGAPRLARGIDWKEELSPQSPGARQLAAAGRGLLIALPMLLVFGGLFMAADAVFSSMISNTFQVDVEEVAGHTIVIGVLFWLVAGWLSAFTLGASGVSAIKAGHGRLGITEGAIVLVLLNTLFLGFTLVQVKYLFGGAELVQATTGLTYAEYARRGFFELVTVSALVVPMLLTADWVLDRKSLAAEWIFRGLAGLLVGLLLVIMASAVYRMRVYQEQFGLTVLRFYTVAFMLWIGTTLVWFAATVLRARRSRFALGAFASGVATVAALNLANPDVRIATVNLRRAAAGKTFDASYAGSLSADSAPLFAQSIGDLPLGQQCGLARPLVDRWAGNPADWRSWSWAEQRARRAVSARSPELREAVKRCAGHAATEATLLRIIDIM